MNEENTAPVQRNNDRHRRDTSFGPTAGVLVIVAILVFLITDGSQSTASNQKNASSSPTVSGSAFLGGFEHQSNSAAFRSAAASAFMGGVKLDFRNAQMEGDEARIDVSAIMGGIDIRIPRDWTVVNRVTPVMGGVTDRTRPADGSKRLVIEGTVLMGGLEIKN